MTKSKNSINYPPLFASAKYYSKEDFQFPVTAVSKIVTSQTVLKKNSGITLLYFRDSNGKIVVNTRGISGKPGHAYVSGGLPLFPVPARRRTHEGRTVPLQLRHLPIYGSQSLLPFLGTDPGYRAPDRASDRGTAGSHGEGGRRPGRDVRTSPPERRND